MEKNMIASPFFSPYKKLALLVMVILISACSSKQPPPSNPPNFTTAKIYINQIAFDVQAPKHAVVALPLDETASRFIIYEGSDIIYQGELTAQTGFNEWGEGAHYYLADFSSIKRRGAFHVVVRTQKQKLSSSVFNIKQNAYFDLTANSLINFFKLNRQSKPEEQTIDNNEAVSSIEFLGGWSNPTSLQNENLDRSMPANFSSFQQAALATWAMAKSYEKLSQYYDQKALTLSITEEVLWGADYLHRVLTSEADLKKKQTNKRNVDVEVSFFDDETKQPSSSHDNKGFHQVSGIAIAALAKAYELSHKTGVQGEFTAKQYLLYAERSFIQLQKYNKHNVHTSRESIFDDYSTLIAATTLYRITKKTQYLKVARYRAHNLNSRITSPGWFVRGNNQKPFYHTAEASFPIIALADYLSIERNRQFHVKTKRTIKLSLDHQLTLTSQVSNPFGLARQSFSPYISGQDSKPQQGFFMPHASKTNDWWHGENARIASLATAAIWGGKLTHSDKSGAFGINSELAMFSQNQIDWILGKNPYQICMLYSLGVNNPPQSKTSYIMLDGGISNGITGATLKADGRGMTWAEGPEENNWRWTEQSLQNSAWYLLAITAMIR